MTKPNWLDEACKRPPTTEEQVVIELLARQEAERQRDDALRQRDRAMERAATMEREMNAARTRLEAIVDVLEDGSMDATGATVSALYLAKEPLVASAVDGAQTVSSPGQERRMYPPPLPATPIAGDDLVALGNALSAVEGAPTPPSPDPVPAATQENDGPKIPQGDFYDCRDGEELRHESPEEALEEWIELWCTIGCDVSAVIREHSPVTLLVFRQDEVDDVDLTSWAQKAVDDAQQAFDDEYGDPEGGTDNGLDDGAAEEYRTAVRAALVKFVARGTVWRCTKIASVDLEAEQVETMLREYRPDWWDEGGDQ